MSHTNPIPVSRHPAGGRELKEEFAVHDRDRDCRLNFDEFTSLLQGLDAGMSVQELHIGFREVDTDNDGFIDFREFAQWWSED
jgi:Ca2+-binding EF-hand superfamily protein